jgi:hypothetical protein
MKKIIDLTLWMTTVTSPLGKFLIHALLTFCSNFCLSSTKQNKDRQSLLALEDCWPTKSPWFCLVMTLIGMSVVDLHQWDRNRRSGGKGLLNIGDDEGNPNFLSVRSIANLVLKGPRCEDMKYRNRARYSHPMHGSVAIDNPGSALIRITDKDGCEKWMSGQSERE